MHVIIHVKHVLFDYRYSSQQVCVITVYKPSKGLLGQESQHVHSEQSVSIFRDYYSLISLSSMASTKSSISNSSGRAARIVASSVRRP